MPAHTMSLFCLQLSNINCTKISKLICACLFICFSFNSLAVTLIEDIKGRQKDEILFNIHAYYIEDLPLQSSFDDHQQFVTLLNNLDPYSKFLNENELDDLFNSTNGRYTGLGIEVQAKDEQVIVTHTLKNSPAAKAGIQKDDVLLAINNHSVKNMKVSQLADLVKQSNSATIHLTMTRNNEMTPFKVAVTRSEINIETVTSSVNNFGIGYMAINSFTNQTLNDVLMQLTSLKDDNGGPLTGLVLDLRDNPGGILQSAVAVSDLFLQSGTIVSTKGRFNDANQQFTASKGDVLDGSPIVVLINEQSASAAEILAAALKENQRATLVGNQSFGKGSVQSLIPLSNGKTALKLTTAKYFSPSGMPIDGIGVAPDVTVKQSTLSQINKVAIIKSEQQGMSVSWLGNNLADEQLLKAKELLSME